MIVQYQTIYQGPGQPPTVLHDGDVYEHNHFIQVGWSLLRNLTRLSFNCLVDATQVKGDEGKITWFRCNRLSVKPDGWCICG